MFFCCEFCSRVFKYRSGYHYHISNRVCRKYVCEQCNKCLKTKNSLDFHIKNNVCRQLVESLSSEQTNEENEELKRTNWELEREVLKLRSKVETMQENPQSVNTNVNIFFPVEFGTEDINRVLEKMPSLLHDSLKRPTQSVKTLIKNIHCNPEIAEYNNVFIGNKKEPFASVFDGRKFMYRPKKMVIKELIDSKRNILNKYVDENGDKIGERVLKYYEKYEESLDNKEVMEDLEVDITCMLLNMKDIIEQNERDRRLIEKLKEVVE